MPVSLQESAKVSPKLAQVFWNRGLKNKEQIQSFLNPTLKNLIHPEEWNGMTEASSLLAEGFKAGKTLAIWGDYDVDGTTSTALVIQVLSYYGLPYLWHLPNRITEGYGLNSENIEILYNQGAQMLLTVDCGISDIKPIQKAKELGMTVILSDHHKPSTELPCADVICNPRIGVSPTSSLAGVGVTFYLMLALNPLLAEITQKEKLDMRYCLDLVALGTLADMVPLEEQNRILVKNGLLKITDADRPGIAALKIVSKHSPTAKLTAGQVVFNLAPRINAAGRMADASLALKLLISEDHDDARKYAQILDQNNTARRQEEEIITKEAHEKAIKDEENPAIIVTGENWNQGIIGIVASRLVEKYHRPVFVFTRDGDAYKGSARSISSIDIHAALIHCEDLILTYGGHPMAAGLRVLPENIEPFREKFFQYIKDMFGNAPFIENLKIEAELNFVEASDFLFLKELEEMHPFGMGNPEPIFVSPPLVLRKQRLFGYKKEHVTLDLWDETTNITLQAKAWRQADRFQLSPEMAYATGQGIKRNKTLEGVRIQIAYSPSLDYYNGVSSINIKIRDWKLLP